MPFEFSAPCQHLPDNIEFCFHWNPILPWEKDFGQFRASSVKEKDILCEVKRFTKKSRTSESFALCTVRRRENNINRYKDTSKHKGYVDTAQPQKINEFWCKLSDCKLRPKSSES